MSVGHTRCTVDGYFGLLKKKVRNSAYIDTMTQLVAAVGGSSHLNEAQLFHWQWREWDAFLMRFFKQIRGITKFHHFCVKNTEPRIVYMKESVCEVEQVFQYPEGRCFCGGGDQRWFTPATPAGRHSHLTARIIGERITAAHGW